MSPSNNTVVFVTVLRDPAMYARCLEDNAWVSRHRLYGRVGARTLVYAGLFERLRCLYRHVLTTR